VGLPLGLPVLSPRRGKSRHAVFERQPRRRSTRCARARCRSGEPRRRPECSSVSNRDRSSSTRPLIPNPRRLEAEHFGPRRWHRPSTITQPGTRSLSACRGWHPLRPAATAAMVLRSNAVYPRVVHRDGREAIKASGSRSMCRFCRSASRRARPLRSCARCRRSLRPHEARGPPAPGGGGGGGRGCSEGIAPSGHPLRRRGIGARQAVREHGATSSSRRQPAVHDLERFGLDFARIRERLNRDTLGLAGMCPCRAGRGGPVPPQDTMQLGVHNNNFTLRPREHDDTRASALHGLELSRSTPSEMDRRWILGMAVPGESDDPHPASAYKLKRLLRFRVRARCCCTDP